MIRGIMIDHEKLKIAHELGFSGHYYLSIEVGHKAGIVYHVMSKRNYGSSCWETKNFDEAIEKLKELTQPEPKYKVGDTVWMLTGEDFEIESMVIGEIVPDHPDGIWYSDLSEDGRWKQCGWLEEQLYPSRKALIDAQIEYWQNLKNESVKKFSEIKCNHNRRGINAFGGWEIYKCDVCGKFYR